MILNRPLLDDWKRKEGRSWKWLARQLEVSPETFYHQLAGRYGVSLQSAIRLEEVTGIAVRSLVVKEKASA